MIGERELCMMKSTAVFINTARGNMVDEQALRQHSEINASGLPDSMSLKRNRTSCLNC